MADMWLGLDLGQFTDYSALAIVRRELLVRNGLPVLTASGHRACRFDVVALKRYPLKTPYRDVVSHVEGLLRRPDLNGARLAVDATGVGAGVVEMIDAVVPDHMRAVQPVMITAGYRCTREKRFWHVPKAELTGTLRSALESGTLKIAKGVDHAETLKQELLDFQVRITRAANQVFEAGPGQHDDLVISVALPVRLGSHPVFEPSSRQDNLTPVEEAAIKAEEAAIRRGEYDLQRQEKDQARRTAEEREKARQAAIDDDFWWLDGGPRHFPA
jgi:hypothetical protein